jgi:O-antigen ligase
MGPFANRNHFATWLVMAVPLAMSYLLMRLESRDSHRDRRPFVTQLTGTLEARNLWLVAAATTMSLAVVVSASRSGLVALVASGLFGGMLGRPFMKRRSRTWLVLSGALVALVLASYADVGHVMQRVEMTFAPQASPGRLVIWRDTWLAVRDFWLTGTGAGTYQEAMVVYQVALRGVTYLNQAHNHYLQVMQEGGLLLTIPALVALIAVGAGTRQRLLADETGTRWLRAGAATGLFAAAVQSIWETGLRMPANALLCAALLAIALHEPPAAHVPGSRSGTRRRR